MTISTTTNSVQYTGNGVTTAFAVPFIFYDASDLIVTYTVIATGVDTVKTITTDYTVSGGDGSTGTVTALSAPASTIRITIERSIPYTQESDLLSGAAVLAETWEEVADRNVVLSQQLLASSNRALKFPATLSGSFTGLLPAPEDGKILVWDGATGQIANADIADLSTTVDTVFTGLASGDFLTYDGANWTNTAKDSLVVNGMQTDSSSGIVMENSGGTTVMTVGPTNTTNVAIAGGLTLGTVLSGTYMATATDSAQGAVELATDAELQTGTATARAVTPANIKNSLGFSDYFESSQQTITAAGALTVAHGLGRTPKLIYPVLQCTTAEHNYSIGDEVPVSWPAATGSASGIGVSCVPDATNLNLRFGNYAGGTFIILNKTSGATESITNSSWRLVLRAWA